MSDPFGYHYDSPEDPPEEQGIECCPRCGSSDLTGRRETYESGVVAPDGGREMLTEEFAECRSCKARWTP